MRRFRVPFDIEFEDKIIGGRISLRQAAWFALPIMHIFSFLSKLGSNKGSITAVSLILNLFLFVVLASVSAVFAFYKKNTLTYDKYIIKKIKFMMRRKDYKFYD